MNRCGLAVLALLAGSAHLPQPTPSAARVLLQRVLEDQVAGARGPVYLLPDLRWNYDTRRNTFEQWNASLGIPGWLRPRPDTLLRRFWDANQHRVDIKDTDLQLGPNVRLLRPGERAADTASELALSQVAINSAGDSALVAVRFLCGVLCGSDELLLYVRKAGMWRRERILYDMNY